LNYPDLIISFPLAGRTRSSNLRKVFDKIKAQREEWIRQSIQESPERDGGRDTESATGKWSCTDHRET